MKVIDKCIVCGKEFESHNMNVKQYCSVGCEADHYNLSEQEIEENRRTECKLSEGRSRAVKLKRNAKKQLKELNEGNNRS